MLGLVRPPARSPLHHPPLQPLQPAQTGRAGGSSAWRGGASGAAGFIPVGRGAWTSCAAAGGATRPGRRRGQRFQFEGAGPCPGGQRGELTPGQFGALVVRCWKAIDRTYSLWFYTSPGVQCLTQNFGYCNSCLCR